MSQPARDQPARDQAASGQAALGRAAGGQAAGEQAVRRQPGRQPVLRRLCPPVLVFEAIVIGLAIPVAITIEHLHGSVAGAVGGALAAVAVILAGVAGRARWGLVAGSALQVLIIASGIVIPAMYALGVIFAGLWATAIWLARRLEQQLPGAAVTQYPRAGLPGIRGQACPALLSGFAVWRAAGWL